MSVKTVNLDGLGPVHLHKRRGVKAIRLSISRTGEIRLSLPFWSSYASAMAFATDHIQWITDHRPKNITFAAGARIGRRHRLVYQSSANSTIKTRLDSPDIIIKLPRGTDLETPAVQKIVDNVCIRALKAEAKLDLPGRLAELAQKYGFTYGAVSIKRLTGRWGSCDSKQNITLNCYLQQLPDNLVSYVLLHELVHTRLMAHGKPFWDELKRYDPQVMLHRTQIKQHQPVLRPTIVSSELVY